ncbi:Asp23/Gls24 family envelope stress response protein [Amycolatopsis sp. OK19-0408]|uniref:Asp23/Gls24 family envelope stress response protein n=1 Tax=Amycolatopsis iheyensis TaxID=2945988 RepID=A0A9X2SHJ4_9PSEU|nr:Asp23/Gls24 family envelope stress response protein [Amycolatopsis iheyensis]MCR6482797.1 Asp23/Gls24 family envelope stress response protein [Amycolatopsis iheyensis]
MTSTSVPPEERGELTVAERAVERLAAHAAQELGDVGGAAERVLGVAVGGEDAGRSVKVDAHLDGDRVRLAARLSIAYPSSVTRTTEDARAHLRGRVEELTGLRVDRVDITVTALHGPVRPVRRVS